MWIENSVFQIKVIINTTTATNSNTDEIIAFALTDTVVLTVLGQVAFMPTLVLASSLCPPGVEGTLFATLMSIYNASGTVSDYFNTNTYTNINILG